MLERGGLRSKRTRGVGGALSTASLPLLGKQLIGLMEDPFYAVRDDLSASLANAKRTFARWQGLLRSAPASAELSRVASELRSMLLDMDADLAELEEAVTIAEQNPGRFRLAASEVRDRKAFVGTTKKAVEEIRTLLQSEGQTQQQTQRDLLFTQPATKPEASSAAGASKSGVGAGDGSDKAKNGLLAIGGSSEARDGVGRGPGRSNARMSNSGVSATSPSHGYDSSDAYRSSNNRFIENEQMAQQQIMREQDYALEGVHSTVRNLREIAITIGDEVDDQRVLLEDLDDHVDTTQDRLQLAMKRLNAVLAELRKGGTFTIICLIVVLVILLIVVIVI